MNLASYLDLYEVLASDTSTRSERRTFGLTHSAFKNRPALQLLTWAENQKMKLKRPRLSETLSAYLHGVTLVLFTLAFVLGFFSGIALLSYNGHEPVNVIYFMAMVILVPLFTMTLTLLSMFRANQAHSMLVHISPAYWMERMVSLLPNTLQRSLNKNVSQLSINPLVANWLVIKRSQGIALFFSFGLFLALLGMVATKDIAFAWSTTLSVTPESFHDFLNTLAFPWKTFFPGAVPSLVLVEQSQYYRLGETLGDTMIQHASLLGEWWKFLALATLFYAIILRFFVFLLSSFGLKKAIERAVVSLEGSQELLHDMNEPVISTTARVSESSFATKELGYEQLEYQLKESYDAVLGWAIDKDKLRSINDSMKVKSAVFFEVGGANSLDEDKNILNHCQGEILLYVKSWEPPTMDFIDFVEMLVKKVDKVLIVPIGTVSKQYETKESDLNVWARKLSTLKSTKIWLKA